MRICRYRSEEKESLALYHDYLIFDIPQAILAFVRAMSEKTEEIDLLTLVDEVEAFFQTTIPKEEAARIQSIDQVFEYIESLCSVYNMLDWLPPHQDKVRMLSTVEDWILSFVVLEELPFARPTDSVDLLNPIARPEKIFLLAGNYAKHVEEQGGIAAERKETFPWLFMKPNTTLNVPNGTFYLPKIAPDYLDWEAELGIVIGKTAKSVTEDEALDYVAGYTVINDISHRKFYPNPERKERERDKFFDWQHGKWFDGSCPCGPCITSSDEIKDPQTLQVQLKRNDELRQDSNTEMQVFPVAAVIEFVSQIMTLSPGDIISTGTPAGVGNATGTYLKAGDLLEASITGIGTLSTRIEAES